MSLPKHTSFKPAVAPWIQEIPSHWVEKPFYALARERKVKNKGMKEDNLLSLSYGEIVRKDINTPNGLLPESFETYQIVEPDDVIFRLTDLQNDKRSLRSAICSERGIITSAYLAAQFEGILPAFMNYLMRAYDVQKVFYSMGGGLRQSLGFEDLRRMSIVSPSIDEQVAVVNFLDHETSQIDRLIKKKSRFIELLTEKRVVEIIAAISPKESWKVFPFWSIAKSKSVSGHPEEGLLSVYLDRGVIPYSEGGGLVHKPAESLEKYQLVEPGDLVMNNQQAWRGSLGVSNHRGIVSPAYLVLHLDQTKIDPSFANYMFRARPYVEKFMLASMSVGDIQRQIKWPHLRVVPVTVPDVAEQKRLAVALDQEGDRIAGLITKTERSIELLKEKRSALITAAVTGKIDARTAA
ncbi:EcoKI restriction-modification system protein HsdS [Pseudooceanicola marinus]|uniref:EcoKI restriction-modification system protein HsdS n=1 Tax=Pseudooceanicola marinus TaxID=396013 RepID=A0A1X6YFP6_9RHOB|nr:restriction endonuclease subunit S [Pseudooceanicola marinus]PJE27340.1 restriction endonuclease subunit S [Pseudooceanicola marinus]SLN19730.1 EcoKI restriction-modification system protein HsdS [Pseudooceanicola marinus]